MKIYDFKQGSDEWFQVRLGKFTGSKATAIANNGKGMDTLIFEKVNEILFGRQDNNYTNKHLERGVELEPKARNLYEIETGNIVKQVGFVELNEFVGYSPDGLVGDDGLIEIKSPSIKVFYSYLETGKIDTGHLWQMMMGLYVTGRKWCDYVVYNSYFKKPLIIKRVERDEKKIEKIKAGLEQGIDKMKKILKQLRGQDV